MLVHQAHLELSRNFSWHPFVPTDYATASGVCYPNYLHGGTVLGYVEDKPAAGGAEDGSKYAQYNTDVAL